MQVSGAAEAIAQNWMSLAGDDPWGALTVVYVLTALFTAFLTNIAAAVLMFLLALPAAVGIQASPYPFMVAIMMAA